MGGSGVNAGLLGGASGIPGAFEGNALIGHKVANKGGGNRHPVDFNTHGPAQSSHQTWGWGGQPSSTPVSGMPAYGSWMNGAVNGAATGAPVASPAASTPPASSKGPTAQGPSTAPKTAMTPMPAPTTAVSTRAQAPAKGR